MCCISLQQQFFKNFRSDRKKVSNYISFDTYSPRLKKKLIKMIYNDYNDSGYTFVTLNIHEIILKDTVSHAKFMRSISKALVYLYASHS